MKVVCWLSFVLSLSLYTYSQQAVPSSSHQDSLEEQRLDEVIIYSGKFAERKKHVAQKVEVITASQIAQTNSQNTGDLLMNTGNLFVQKSQQGSSSPVIRGFEASRVLLLIDGIRLNNAIFRSGHLQNIITVDQNMLEGIEIMYGPSSTLYGSDALGGAVLLRTKMPQLSPSKQLAISGAAFTRYSSANKEKTAHLDISIGKQKLAWLQAYNYSDFGDMKMGNQYPHQYPDFGRRSQYIITISGMDSIVSNSDDRIQKFSAYRQWDITQKLLWKQTERISHLLNLQYSNSSDIPRYDRLQDRRNGQLRYAAWYYGPQTRQLAAYELNISQAGFFNQFKAILSYQHLQESRHTREYRRYSRFDHRSEEVHVWNFTVDGRKLWQQNELTLGMDGQLNKVASTAYRQNLQTGATSPLDSRYPNGENNMGYLAAYAQHILKFKGGKLVLNDGLRLQAVHLHSTIENNSFFHLPFTAIRQDNLAVTGNAGLIYHAKENLRVSTNLSTGFRAPNIDDAAKIFESDTAGRRLIVPNADIQPEYTYNIDFSIAKTFAYNSHAEVTAFYTWYRNAIALTPYPFNGEDSTLYNGVMSRTFANQNGDKAFVYGLTATMAINVVKRVELYNTITYTYGRRQNIEKIKVPLDHIPPLYGRTSVTYKKGMFTAEVYALYNGWKRLKDYNPDGEDNGQYATSEGMPAWWTLNVKSSIQLSNLLSLQVGVENIMDRNYRHFASGFSAPGRNILIALRSKF
jgi:hemoglobin/transferrin/lactoferrin receptor protein